MDINWFTEEPIGVEYILTNVDTGEEVRGTSYDKSFDLDLPKGHWRIVSRYIYPSIYDEGPDLED